jgi:two-component system LytT family response regulator
MKKRLCLHDTQGKFYLALDEIIRFEADDSYTIIHVLGGKKYTLSGAMHKFYDRVKQEGLFFRIHKSHVISVIYVFRVNNSGTVIMMDGSILPISEEAKNEIEGSIPSC